MERRERRFYSSRRRLTGVALWREEVGDDPGRAAVWRNAGRRWLTAGKKKMSEVKGRVRTGGRGSFSRCSRGALSPRRGIPTRSGAAGAPRC
jgi:hypothetical protein